MRTCAPFCTVPNYSPVEFTSVPKWPQWLESSNLLHYWRQRCIPGHVIYFTIDCTQKKIFAYYISLSFQVTTMARVFKCSLDTYWEELREAVRYKGYNLQFTVNWTYKKSPLGLKSSNLLHRYIWGRSTENSDAYFAMAFISLGGLNIVKCSLLRLV